MNLRRPLAVFGAAAAALALGCSDTGVEPSSEPRNLTVVQGSSALASFGTAQKTASFKIDPNGTTVSLFGIYDLSFPAGSVCDPDRDGCVPATHPIAVKATMDVGNGRISVDFSPHLEFVPTKDVILSTDALSWFIRANAGYILTHRTFAQRFVLLYASQLNGAGQDDSKVDPTARTTIELKTGRVWRRIKHFSGYWITTGLPCIPTPDEPLCVEVDPLNPIILP
jgi:hypothetical protein